MTGSVPRRMGAAVVATVVLAGCGWLPGPTGTFPLTVENQLDVPAVLEITEMGPPTPDGGHPRPLAEPVVVPPGTQVVHLPDPQDQWSLWLRGRNGSFDGHELREWSAQVQRGEIGEVRLIIEANGMSLTTR